MSNLKPYPIRGVKLFFLLAKYSPSRQTSYFSHKVPLLLKTLSAFLKEKAISLSKLFVTVFGKKGISEMNVLRLPCTYFLFASNCSVWVRFFSYALLLVVLSRPYGRKYDGFRNAHSNAELMGLYQRWKTMKAAVRPPKRRKFTGKVSCTRNDDYLILPWTL